jgi:hypothetical protein
MSSRYAGCENEKDTFSSSIAAAALATGTLGCSNLGSGWDLHNLAIESSTALPSDAAAGGEMDDSSLPEQIRLLRCPLLGENTSLFGDPET